jgi:ribosomal protein L34
MTDEQEFICAMVNVLFAPELESSTATTRTWTFKTTRANPLILVSTDYSLTRRLKNGYRARFETYGGRLLKERRKVSKNKKYHRRYGVQMTFENHYCKFEATGNLIAR